MVANRTKKCAQTQMCSFRLCPQLQAYFQVGYISIKTWYYQQLPDPGITMYGMSRGEITLIFKIHSKLNAI